MREIADAFACLEILGTVFGYLELPLLCLIRLTCALQTVWPVINSRSYSDVSSDPYHLCRPFRIYTHPQLQRFRCSGPLSFHHHHLRSQSTVVLEVSLPPPFTTLGVSCNKCFHSKLRLALPCRGSASACQASVPCFWSSSDKKIMKK